MRTCEQIQKYLHYYEIAKKVNYWSTFIRFFAVVTALCVISIFVSLFYHKSIDFTFRSQYNSHNFTRSKPLYVSILCFQIFKLATILLYNAFACVTAFIKTHKYAKKNYECGKVSIITYSCLEFVNIVLCFFMYSNMSINVIG